MDRSRGNFSCDSYGKGMEHLQLAQPGSGAEGHQIPLRQGTLVV